MWEWARESPYLTFFIVLAFFFWVLPAAFKALGGGYLPGHHKCKACGKEHDENEHGEPDDL